MYYALSASKCTIIRCEIIESNYFEKLYHELQKGFSWEKLSFVTLPLQDFETYLTLHNFV